MDVEGQGTCRTCHQPTLTIRPATDRYCRCGALLDVGNGTTALEGRKL